MNAKMTNAPDRKALKQKYLKCFDVRIMNATTWREVVTGLIDQGVSRHTLVNWAVDAGHSRITVSSMVCRILVSLGLRERREGAGRKTSPYALELLEHARIRYGARCLKVLRAAYRTGSAQLKAGVTQDQSSASATHATRPRRKLGQNGQICGTAIRPSRAVMTRMQPVVKRSFQKELHRATTVKPKTRRKQP